MLRKKGRFRSFGGQVPLRGSWPPRRGSYRPAPMTGLVGLTRRAHIALDQPDQGGASFRRLPGMRTEPDPANGRPLTARLACSAHERWQRPRPLGAGPR